MATDSQSQPKIVLFRGWKDTGRYVWSPFVTKIELRLRLAGRPYQTDVGSPRDAPRGKIPWIEVSDDTSAEPDALSDSTLIIKGMIENGLVDDINCSLSPSERAVDLALRAMLEDKLYFYHVRGPALDSSDQTIDES